MADTVFDPDLNFDENLEVLLADLDGRAPALSVILRKHLHLLTEGDDDASRRQLRDTFNRRVKAELDTPTAVEPQ